MKKGTKSFKRTAVTVVATAMVLGLSCPMLNKRDAGSAAWNVYAADDDPYEESSNGTFYYMKYADHIAISGLKSEPTDLVIPETIDGLPVTKIAMYSFEYLSIKSVTFPDSIKEIDSYSFSDCPNLTEVTLPKNIERIGFHVFENCTALKTVNFPEHLVKTADFTFENTPWLTAQRQENPLVVVNQALIDARTATGDVTVPAGVKYVAGGAFSKNDKVTSVVFPSSVTEVADSTFWMCSNLKSVSAVGAEVLGTTAFGYCEKLTDLKISKKLKKIQPYCFSDCTGSATITFYGTQDDWGNVEILDTENFLKNAKIVFDDNYVEEVVGDINMDGKLNIADVVLLQKWLLTEQNTELKNWKAGDLCADGVLNVLDLSALKSEFLNSAQQRLRMADVFELSKMDRSLNWSDFTKYQHGEDIGSGLSIFEFPIADYSDRFQLLVGLVREDDIQYVLLKSAGNSVDICDCNLDEIQSFICENNPPA